MRAPNFDLKSHMDFRKENASDKDISDGKAKITRPFRYVIPQSEIEERVLASSKGKIKEFNPTSEKDQDKLQQIIVETMQDDSEVVVNRLKEKFANFDDDKYNKKRFMKTVELKKKLIVTKNWTKIT